MEGLIFGGAYLWREICVSKSIGLALSLEGFLPFLLYSTLYLRASHMYGGAYFRDFTVCFPYSVYMRRVVLVPSARIVLASTRGGRKF